MKRNKTYIMGRNTLEEILKHSPEIVLKVYVNINQKVESRKDKLINNIKTKKIDLINVSKNKLFSLVNSESHQSFVAEIKPRRYMTAQEFIKDKKDSSLVLALDNISDPQNMGAIIRAAECFKIDAIIFSKNRGTDITPTVSKVSCGSSEMVPLIRVSNLANTIDIFKKNDYTIISSENSKEAKNLFDFEISKKTILILGSEEKGIQSLLRNKSDVFVKIPLRGKVSSLNVSQASAIFLAFFSYKNIKII